jgi:hypothetical protein
LPDVIVDGSLEHGLVWKTTIVGLSNGGCTDGYNDGEDSTQVFLNAIECGGHDDGNDDVWLYCDFWRGQAGWRCNKFW